MNASNNDYKRLGKLLLFGGLENYLVSQVHLDVVSREGPWAPVGEG